MWHGKMITAKRPDALLHECSDTSHVSHLLDVNEKDLNTCKDCGKQYQTQDGLKYHMECHDKSGTKNPYVLLHDCCKTSYVSPSLDVNEKRLNTKNAYVLLHDCLETSPALHTLDVNKKRLYTCKECGRQCQTQDSLNYHMESHQKGVAKNSYVLLHDYLKTSPTSHSLDVNEKHLYTCKECGKQSLGGLRYHEEGHHKSEKLFTCAHCETEFKSKACRKKHMVMHREDKPLSCNTCGKKFRKRSNLNKHLGAHTLPYTCNKCGKKYARQSGLDYHITTYHNKKKLFRCKECGKGFTSEAYVKKHQVLHTGGKPFPCDSCGMRFSLKSNLTRHLHLHNLTYEERLKYCCQECDKRYSTKIALKAHQQLHLFGEQLRPYACSQCDKAFPTKTKLNTHAKTHVEKVHFCGRCGKSFGEKVDLEKHALVHLESFVREKPFSCTVCSMKFAWKGNLHRHMRRHTGEKPFVCGKCGKAYSHKRSLIDHHRFHSEDELLIFPCSQCGKMYASEASLQQHAASHIAQKLFHCKECEASFTSRNALKIHMRRLHTGDQPYTCTECSQSFFTFIQLDKHEASKHGYNRLKTLRTFKCTFCEKRFVHKTVLERHIKKVHIMLEERENEPKKETPTVVSHACDKCGKIYKSRHNLIHHCLVHTGDNPYVCSVCSKTFTCPRLTRSHMLRSHPRRVKKWICKTCGQAFYTRAILNVHERTHGQNNEPSDSSL